MVLKDTRSCIPEAGKVAYNFKRNSLSQKVKCMFRGVLLDFWKQSLSRYVNKNKKSLQWH